MRKLKFFIFFSLCLSPILDVFAQDDEMQILAKDLRHSGGYGALIFKSTNFKDQSFVLMGGRGVWVINRAFGIGFEGNGIVPINTYDGIDPDGNMAILIGGYGGLVLEPILWSNKLLHITFPVSGGAGWLGYVPDWESNNYDPMMNSDLYDDDIFWYIEPGASIELNVARFFRVAAGATRRFTQDLQLVNTNPSELEKFNFSLTLKFGSF